MASGSRHSEGLSGQLAIYAGMAVAFAATIVFAVVAARSVPQTEVGAGVSMQRTTRIDPARRAPRPGVTATIEGGGVTVTRGFPALAFRLEADETLDARVPPGPFTATFTLGPRAGRATTARLGADLQNGQLTIRRGEEILLADAAGPETRLALSSPTQLVRVDPREPLTYEFTRTGEGPAVLRAMWQPIDSVTPLPLPSDGAPLIEEAAHQGRRLVQRAHCVGCHESGDASRQTLLAMHPGPNLDDLGDRVRPNWLRGWLADPAALSPGTRMPDLAHHDHLDGAAIEDLVHFLIGPATLPDTVGSDAALARTGAWLYDRVGCFACHGPLGDAGGDAWRAYAPLGAAARKWSIESLAAFLADPLASRPNGLMPDQQLEPTESRALATFLLEREHAAGRVPGAVAPFAFDPARAVRGAARFAGAGCAACHARTAVSTTPIASTLAAPAFEDLPGAGGCLAETPPAGAPDYGFDRYEREAIAAYLAEAAAGPAHPAPGDELALHLEQFACTACHAYQGALGPGPAVTRLFATEGEADLGDEGRLPPDLSGAGGRLTTSWMHAVLADEARARPYLATRMPQFGAAATTGLPRLFAAAAGANDRLAEEPAFSADLARHGRTLVGADGLNCIECHRIAGHEATGTPGPDLAEMPGRLLPDSFRRWVRDPARVRPGTRMPSFFVDGRSAFTDMLGGDAVRQVDAIWAYLSQGTALPLPDGLIDPAGYDLVVGEEPVVFRSFLRDAGVRAIACGFPEQIHCAFDADLCAVTMAWEGRFLSAQGAWGSRGGSETNPDATAWVATGARPLAIAAPETAPDAVTTTRFRGYELDAERAPVFLYELRCAGTVIAVRERPRPRRSGATVGLRRHFELSGPPGAVVSVDASDPAVSASVSRVFLDADGRAAFELEVTW